MKRKIELGTVLFFIFAAILASCIATYMYMAHMVERTTGKSDMFEKLAQVYQVVNNRYVGEFDENETMDALLKGYIGGVDEYGVYLNKTSYLEFKKGLEGKASGIGMNVQYIAATGYLKVTRVRSGSPGEDAGVLPGDIIIKINDNDIAAMSYTDATDLLKAEVGSSLKLTIQRGDESLALDVEVQEYTEATVTTRRMVDDIAYIAISSFDVNTAEDFIEIVEDYKKQGVKKYIFDVRNNTGGSLTAVTEILDYILPEGLLCSVRDKNGEEETYKSDADSLEGEVVVLINGSTYSGGELFAAAIRDFKYGQLIGVKTYGKGMAQEIIPLGDDTAVYLSTHLYYPPSGRNFDGEGVAPHLDVALSDELEARFYELTFDEDVQLQAAMEALQ